MRLAHDSVEAQVLVMNERYYQVVLIWMKDPPKFARYLEQMAPIVRRYGGSLERMLEPETIYGAGLSKPDTINVVFYDDREAFLAFNRDAEFQNIAHLRSESIDMIAIGGAATGGRVTDGGEPERLYTVEIARFTHEAAYRSYEQEAAPVMRGHGYQVERALAPDSTAGLGFTPDVVKVAYFESRDALDRLRRDPAHHRIENELYPSAVAESIRVFGRVHPSSLER
jgi:uncharacterized protein (DUF1330 family)